MAVRMKAGPQVGRDGGVYGNQLRPNGNVQAQVSSIDTERLTPAGDASVCENCQEEKAQRIVR